MGWKLNRRETSCTNGKIVMCYCLIQFRTKK